ncbi:MAG: hypothetical protein KQJ78_20055 [Deltaproteobacteria bacterium]|nr:hypothetical protein [Deltaproteobacteria bacterium]
MKYPAVGAMLLCLLGSCVGCITTADMGALTPEQRAMVGKIPVVKQGEKPDFQYTEIKEVEGASCFRNMYADEIAKEEKAREFMRILAVQAGGDAVVDCHCYNTGFDLVRNRWAAWVCKGRAVKMAK